MSSERGRKYLRIHVQTIPRDVASQIYDINEGMSGNHKKLISSPVQCTEWMFLSYVTEAGRDVIAEWDVIETFEAGESFRAMIKNAAKIDDYSQWTCWHHRMGHNAARYNLVELKFPADGRQYRVIAKFNGKKCIVLLCVCFHKQSVWTPASAIRTAITRAKALQAGKGKTNVIQIDRNF